MPLDFYVNHERFSNSTLFYRTTGNSAQRYYNVTVKLSDVTFADEDLYSLYTVKYSVNQRPFQLFVPDDNGRFQTTQIIDTSVPCICSFAVSVSAQDVETNYFHLTAKIIPYFPQIDFVAHPSLYVNLSTGILKEITTQNYALTSRGVYFYGEGHTEVITLSSNANISYNTHQNSWYVGNSVSEVLNNPLSSMWGIELSSNVVPFHALSGFYSENTTAKISADQLNWALSNTKYLAETPPEDEFSSKKVFLNVDYLNRTLTLQFPTTAYQISYTPQLTSIGPTFWDATIPSTTVSVSSWLLFLALSGDTSLSGPGVNITNVDSQKKTITYTFSTRTVYNPATLTLSSVTYTWAQSSYGLEFAFAKDRPSPVPTGSIYLHDRFNHGVVTNHLNGVLLSANNITKRIEFWYNTIAPLFTPVEILSTSSYTTDTSAIGVMAALGAQQEFYKSPMNRKTLDTWLTQYPAYTAIRINDVILSTLSPLDKGLSFYYPATGFRPFETASVKISSEVGMPATYPIHLWSTNGHVTKNGPVHTYDDVTGLRKYYPFFASTIAPDGRDTGLNENGLLVVDNPQYFNNKALGNRLKGSIQVLEYRKSVISVLENPFPSSNILLPVDYTSEPFWTFTSTEDIFGDAFVEKFYGTKWELQATSQAGDWSIQTRFLSAVPVYQFKLCYDEDTANPILPTFKASAEYPTAVTLTVSSYKEVYIDKGPKDWKKKLVSTVNSVTATIEPIPINKIYTPNYYYIRNQDVPFTIISYPDYPLSIDEIVLTSANSKETLILSKLNPTGTMKFDIIGVADIKVSAAMKNLITDSIQNVTFVYQDMVEIVKNLDDAYEKDSLHTKDSSLIFSNDKPRITPNEWVTEDVVNSVIKKFFTNIQELISFSKLYDQKFNFYAYLAPEQKLTSLPSIPLPIKKAKPAYVWLDLDCALDDVTDEFAAWNKFLAGNTSTWEWQNCKRKTDPSPDPSALEKYCIQWTWRWRKKGATNVNVKWYETKSTDSFAKKWRYEPCTIAPVVINCNRTRWFTSTIDFEEFPIPSSMPINRCLVVDAEINNSTNQMVVAHPTEIQLLNRDKNSSFVASSRMADDLIGFQNIIGLTTNEQGKVIVLDNYIPRVTIYQIDQNDFIQIDNWGKYGTAQSPQGFKNPKDVYVDYENRIWIADYGNFCLKKFNFIGKNLQTITHPSLENNGPLSICMDSSNNIHCLTEKKVIVFNTNGEYFYEYLFETGIEGVKKINASTNKHMIYITHRYGVAKYFKNGTFAFHIIKDYVCRDGYVLEGYNSISQDIYRNLYVTVGDKILQIPELQRVVELKAPIDPNLLWKLEDLLIHKEEYVQPWVYLKAFHRLWDNIELLRSSLFYNDNLSCKTYVAPKYAKKDLIIGQNEIVSNTVINRVIDQLWENFESILKYFDSSCKN